MGISAPPAGIAPKGKPNAVPRSHGFQDRFQSCLLIHGRPTGMTRRPCGAGAPRPRAPRRRRRCRRPRRPRRCRRRAAAMPKVSRGWPVTGRCRPAPIARPSNSAMKPRSREAPSTAVTVTKSEHHQREVVGCAEAIANCDHDRGEEGQQQRGDGAGDERADGRGGQRRAARPAFAILLPSIAVTTEATRPACSAGSRWSSRRTCRRRRCRRT